MRTLIVEDDTDTAKILSTYLSPYGTCDVAWDGQQALQNVELAYEEEEPYDLICLDIMMPTMDGQEALKNIRNHEFDMGVMPGQGARIVMVSALSDSANILESFVGLSDGYIVKPFVKDELVNKLKELNLVRG